MKDAEKKTDSLNSIHPGSQDPAVGERCTLAWAVIFAALMAVFTFLDLPLAKALYHYSDLYGEIFQIVGIVPTCVAGVFFAVSNLCTRRIARRRILSAVLSVLSILFFTGFTLISVAHLDRGWLVPIAVFSVLFLLLSVLANRVICRKANLFELRKVMLIALIAALAAVMGQTVIKFGFNRPRFCTLSDPDTQFTYWFVHHPFAWDSSFPSGHASQSALVFLLLYLKRFIPKLRTKKWDVVLSVAAVFVTGSTMLSRMFLGMHYATDVWAGCFLTLGAISAANRYVENCYMLPNYRLSTIREKAAQLYKTSSAPTLCDAAASLVRKLDVADHADGKGDLVLRLLEIREDLDALLGRPGLSRRERSSLKTIRRLDNRFIKEIRLKNYEDIYSVPVK